MKKAGTQLRLKKTGGWGGRRSGAGRPNASGLVSHARRAVVKRSTPLHLTWRVRPGLINLRCSAVLAEFKRSAAGAKSFGLKVLHYSLLRDHMHLIVEVDDNEGLASGMRSFGCRFGKAVRGIVGGRGPIFVGRYHLSVLENPTKVRNALGYVLQNRARHSRRIPHLDPFSSAPYFGKWRELFGSRMGSVLARVSRVPPPLPDYLSRAESWLARRGWLRDRGPAFMPD